MAECKMYGCHKQAAVTVDVWGFCEQHAKEYRQRFADALEVQRQKREFQANLATYYWNEPVRNK